MTEHTLCRLGLGVALITASAIALQDQLTGAASAAATSRGTEEGDAGPRQKVYDDTAESAPAAAAAGTSPTGTAAVAASQWPHFLPLTHSKVPVIQNNRTVSHKSVYYGRISVGMPAFARENGFLATQQEFKVVFDTGSAHAIVASVDCQEPACHKHQRYNSSMSTTAIDINIDGSWVMDKQSRDTVTVGFGTGSVYADIVREILCISSVKESNGDAINLPGKLCSATHMLVARQMSVLFETATFDGIVGLSFPKLALSEDFSFLTCFARVMGSAAPPQFAFFLADDESGRSSELSLGGHNPARLLSPLSWVPVKEPAEGHWKVAMPSLDVGGRNLEICQDGGCEGIVDTGTSHLGVPVEDLRLLVGMLSRPALETTDCRRVEGLEVVIQLQGLHLTLSPREYMRPLPLRAGTLLNKDSEDKWVMVPEIDENGTLLPDQANDLEESNSSRFTCTPRLFPVLLKPGRKIFLLGEPVLQRYYSVFDWRREAIGFGLADQRPEVDEGGLDESILLQTTASVRLDAGGARLEEHLAVTSMEGLEDATSLGLSLKAAPVLKL